MSQEHSKLPWRITEPNEKKTREIVGADGSTVAKLTALDLSNAELIVSAVNKPHALEQQNAELRNVALEEAAEICDELAKLYTEEVGFDKGYSMASSRAASEIRALKSATPAASQQAKDAERGRFLIENWHSTADGTPLHIWLAHNALRLGGITAVIDYAIELSSAAIAAQSHGAEG